LLLPPKKRAKTTDRDSLRGITMGRVKICSTAIILTTPCVVFSHSFPCWLLVLHELKLTPHAVLLESAIYVDAIRALVPISCQIRVGDWKDVCLPSLGTRAVGLVDGGFNKELGDTLLKWKIKRVVYTRQQRRSLAHWNNISVALRHSHLGGVTLGTCRIGGSFHKAAPSVCPIPFVAPRDASTVLSVKGVAHHYRRAPKQRHTLDFVCENVGTAQRPVYHGGGWLPPRLKRTTRVLTPHIYASTGSWANRTLSWDEILICYDAPDCVVNALEPHQ
jgi:hypothetical protein